VAGSVRDAPCVFSQRLIGSILKRLVHQRVLIDGSICRFIAYS
jgi:hypothetical protein